MPAGLVILVEMEVEQLEMLGRLQSSGHVEQFLTKTPSHTTLLLAMLVGFIAVAVDQALLVGILIAVSS
jgi:hypothetical protein